MPFRVKCPTCEKAFDLPESERDREVRCPNCDDRFIAQPAITALNLDANDTIPEVGAMDLVQAAPADPLAFPPPTALAVPEYQARDRDTLQKVGASMGGAYLMLGLCLVVAIGASVGIASAILNPPPLPPAPPIGPPPRPALGPNEELPKEIEDALARIRDMDKGKAFDPDEFKKALDPLRDKKFEIRFPPPPPNPLAEPKDLEEALAGTRDRLWLKRRTAAEWLAKAPVDPAHREKVNQALLAMLRTEEVLQHAAAAEALFVWADDEAKDGLVVIAKQERAAGNQAALMLLARMKDQRAAPIAARNLTNFIKRNQAARVLELLGPAAEKDVAVYLTDADASTRLEACRIIGRIGTKASLAALDAAAKRDVTLATAAVNAKKMIEAREPK